jgi:RecA-family ATPase
MSAIQKRAAFERFKRMYPIKAMDINEEKKPIVWLAEGLVMEGKINGMFGAEKAGKSRLLGWLLVAMMARHRTLGLGIESPGKIAYMLGEETSGDVVERVRVYCELQGVDTSKIDWSDKIAFWEAAAMKLDTRAQRAWMENMIVELGFDFVIMEPLRRLHAANENDNTAMSEILNDIRRWSNRYGTTFLITHHTGLLAADADESRIATWSRGATDLPAILDWACYLKRFVKDKKTDLLKIMRRGRASPHEDLRILDCGDEVGFKIADSG